MVKDTEPAIKKRRKTTQSAPSTSTIVPKLENGDVYSRVVKFEEQEARSRDSDADYKLFKKNCDDIKKIMLEIAELKLKKTEEAKEQITKKRIDASLLIVILKKLNRLEKCTTSGNRDLLNKLKQKVDSNHLQLENLLYETLHLKKVVNKCFQFKSKDEEIELVSIEDFFKDAPESISRPAETKTDAHLLKRARLEWELQQRKDQSDRCHQLQVAKEQAAKGIVAKQERLENLGPQLDSILDATKPVQEYFGMELNKSKSQLRAARLLATPLYVLYVEADAYKQAWDSSTSVTVMGDEDAARNMGPIKISDSDEEDSDSENTQEPSNHRRHTVASSDPKEERRQRILKTHPLHVEVCMKVKENNAINVTFCYMPYLNIVTVRAQVQSASPVHGIAAGDLIAPHRILASIVPDDIGQDSPNKANKYQLRQAGLDSLPSEMGIPYMWAQQLAGIEVTSRDPPPYISVENLFKRIKQRLNSRIALCRQIQQLEAGLVAVPLSMRGQFPVKLCSLLKEFTPIVWDDYLSYSYTRPLVEEQIVEPNDSFYKAILVRNSATMTALITVKANYPAVQAIFCLQLAWRGELNARNCDAIRDMERELNVYCEDCPKLLAAQLMRLQAALDIYLECSMLGAPTTEFPRDKVFFQPVRGRNRAKPYKYLQTGGGIFMQQ